MPFCSERGCDAPLRAPRSTEQGGQLEDADFAPLPVGETSLGRGAPPSPVVLNSFPGRRPCNRGGCGCSRRPGATDVRRPPPRTGIGDSTGHSHGCCFRSAVPGPWDHPDPPGSETVRPPDRVGVGVEGRLPQTFQALPDRRLPPWSLPFRCAGLTLAPKEAWCRPS